MCHVQSKKAGAPLSGQEVAGATASLTQEAGTSPSGRDGPHQEATLLVSGGGC